MDTSNYKELLRLCSNEKECYKIALILDDKNQKNLSVPDPYYGQEDGFIKIYNLLEIACQNIIDKLQNNE
jgi:protein-tyrosine phosphatase